MTDRAPHRSPEFIKFWVGQSVSLVGSEVSQLAMPLLAVLSLGASPGEMGVLRAVNFAPYLLSLPVGVLVDRTGVGILLTPLWLLFSPVRSLRTVVEGRAWTMQLR